MAELTYDFEVWEDDFSFLAAYVMLSQSEHIPPDSLREIEAYFQKFHAPAEVAAFRFQRFSSMVRFLNPNIDAFTVGGLVMMRAELAEINLSLRIALWTFFGMPKDENFNPEPDPQEVLNIAESVNEDDFINPA
jgi:hypothetical protein